LDPGWVKIKIRDKHPGSATPFRKKGDTIRWQNDRVLSQDEELSPTFEEMILANVLGLIDARLPGFVRQKYQDLLGKAEGLMDYQADILVRVPAFLTEMENEHPATKSGSDVVDASAR
jgi:hypothetical protein